MFLFVMRFYMKLIKAQVKKKKHQREKNRGSNPVFAKLKKLHARWSFFLIGDLERIRTSDPQLRRLLLYPAELRDQSRLDNGLISFGRDYRIRTYDILLPKQALYQAELNPVTLIELLILIYFLNARTFFIFFISYDNYRILDM